MIGLRSRRESIGCCIGLALLIGACAAPAAPAGPSASSFGTAVPSVAPSDTNGATVGEAAPDFRLKSVDGQMLALSDLRGHPVIVNFWATWCGPCKSEMPELQAFYDDQHPKGVEMIAVDMQESVEDVIRFRQSLGINFPTVIDSDGTVSRRYVVRGVPTSYFIDSNGIVQEVHVGPLNRSALNRKLLNLS